MFTKSESKKCQGVCSMYAYCQFIASPAIDNNTKHVGNTHKRAYHLTGNSDVWQLLVSTAQQHKYQTKQTVRDKT